MRNSPIAVCLIETKNALNFDVFKNQSQGSTDDTDQLEANENIRFISSVYS